MPRALLSVTDKTGIVEFAAALIANGFELVSTGGTAAALRAAGSEVTDVSQITGFPELLDGRLKTLHPNVHGGLLGDRSNPKHLAEMTEQNIEPIEVLCVNLYRFEETVSGAHSLSEAIESIDIGGPAMIRAAAKNAAHVAVVTDPADYGAVIKGIESNTLHVLRPQLMSKAFRHTAFYDATIARYLSESVLKQSLCETETFGFRKIQSLRYGENPHQRAALYLDPGVPGGIARARQLWGKELSYNNLLDADAAWELCCDLPSSGCVIVKHGNPCGVAVSAQPSESYLLAKGCDPVSAFGGIAAFNQPVDESGAEAMAAKGNFLEVVIAPEFSSKAVECFRERSGWGQDVRVLEAEVSASSSYRAIRSIRGGALIQDSDEPQDSEWQTVTAQKPDARQLDALKLQWAIVRHVKSNAIIVGTDSVLLGIGAGQMNRVQSVRLALEQAGDRAKGAALASDAFFPFPDSIEVAAQAGIAAIIQPGGSKKDAEVIQAADSLGIAMVFTGVRHFRH